MNKFFKYFFVIAPIVLVAILGSVFVNLGMEWFNFLTKPTQWIPNFVIPIVWTIIYILFIVVLLLINIITKFSIKTIILLITNGVLNVLWCLIFFALNLTLLGNIFIVVNLVFGVWLFVDLQKYKKQYTYLLVTYPTWLCIATTLNMALWILN